MKRLFTILAVMSALTNTISAQSRYELLASEALNKSEWFELKRAYDEGREQISPMLNELSETMIAHNFCTSDSACKAIDKLIKHHGQNLGTENVMSMHFMKSAHLANMKKYAEARTLLDSIITERMHQGVSVPYFHELAKQYAALDSIGRINEITEIETDHVIPFRVDTIWAKETPLLFIMIEAKVNAHPVRILFDTGAGVNVVNIKTAQRLGLTKLNAETRSAGVGGVVTGTYALAKKMELGNLTIENVPFQVYDVSSGVDSIDRKYFNHLDMIMGVEFMRLFNELQIDFSRSCLNLPQHTSATKATEKLNLCGGIHGSYAVEAKINGQPMQVNFDTGAPSTTLQYNYYQRFKQEIEATCETDTLRQAGAGGITIEKGYKIKQVNIEVNGQGHTFPALTTGTSPNSVFNTYANIGMDYFTQFCRIIFNLKERIVRLEK